MSRGPVGRVLVGAVQCLMVCGAAALAGASVFAAAATEENAVRLLPPTLQQHPPALPPAAPLKDTRAVSGVINGIYYIDVLVAAGYNIGSADYGNEPAVTANPLDPNEIVLTSFSGSDWPTGGNASFFYSADGGASWLYSVALPPPPGTSTNYYCPCDQNMDWSRDGIVHGTFLHYNVGGTVASVYSAGTSQPAVPASWVYPTVAGVAQKTNAGAYLDADQPWLWSGPLPGDNSQSNICVAYDNFDASYTYSETRGADSPVSAPMNFTRDAPTASDGQQYGDGMNPGNRIVVGPTGLILNVFQRLVADAGSGVKQLTYLASVSSDGGQTWSVANADHTSGAKLIAANVYSFQGNGSKVGGVNALLGGVDAVGVDPTTGAFWVVYGQRTTTTSIDQLYLVPVTYSAGNLNVGAAHVISPAGLNAYLPAVAVLPSGEVGVLFQVFSGSAFGWRFIQTSDGGVTLAKNTSLTSFTSPFANNGQSNQRIFGDYIQVRAVGCTFYGAYCARGTAGASVNSIDPYFMKAPAAASCSVPVLSGLSPAAACVGGPAFDLGLQGAALSNGSTGRVQGVARPTTYLSPNLVSIPILAGDIAAPGPLSIDLLGASPAGGLTPPLTLTITTAPDSPGASLRLTTPASTVHLAWSAALRATSYAVKRCDSGAGPCTPTIIASPTTNAHDDPVLSDGRDYWYLVDAVNGCGATP